MRAHKSLVGLLLVAALAACGGAAGKAQSTADGTTKAAYANDIDTMTANFDSALKATVTRGQVGTLSDKMHALGDYQGLTLMATDFSKNEYTFLATFSKGKMNVVERLDPNGQIAAYRVFPNAST